MTVSEELIGLITAALAHGIDSVKASGQTLTPFLITQVGPDASHRKLDRFVTGTFEGSVEAARLMASTFADGDVTYCALTYDGFVTVDNRRTDAVIAVGMERGNQSSVKFAQRYRQRGLFRRFSEIGGILSLGEAERLF